MHLLNVKSLELAQFASDIPPYAILSHTWGAEEVTFQDITSPERDKKKGFAKILGCCRQALMDTLEWVWIDTCCIDKTSSAELSEAINSMYAWYRDSQVCYVYLEDVFCSLPAFREDEFSGARWFTRGWCLQELIAPQTLEFFNAYWHDIGSKFSLCDLIEDITAIPKSVLLGQFGALEKCSIAQKMSWASRRNTTRIEDEAYCLLGIFGVNMPMLYGEGDRAFYRLQEEIIRHTEDYSFLLWTVAPKQFPPAQIWYPVCAPRPAFFHSAGVLDSFMRSLSYQEIRRGPPVTDMKAQAPPPGDDDLHTQQKPADITSRGLRIHLSGSEDYILSALQPHLVWTGFTYRESLICIPLIRDPSPGPERYGRLVSSSPVVQLVKPEMARHFQRREMYLVMRPRVPERLARSLFAGGLVGMEIALLSSSDKTAITLGSTDAAVPFELVKLGAENPGSAAGLRVAQVWRAENPSILLPYQFHSQFSVTLFLDTMHRDWAASESANYSSQQAVRVVAHLGRFERCTCTIEEVTAKTGSSPLLSTNPAASDKAEYALRHGEVAIASIKRVAREGGRQTVILRVTVLPGRLA